MEVESLLDSPVAVTSGSIYLQARDRVFVRQMRNVLRNILKSIECRVALKIKTLFQYYRHVDCHHSRGCQGSEGGYSSIAVIVELEQSTWWSRNRVLDTSKIELYVSSIMYSISTTTDNNIRGSHDTVCTYSFLKLSTIDTNVEFVKFAKAYAIVVLLQLNFTSLRRINKTLSISAARKT